MRLIERAAQLFGGSSVAVDIAEQHPLTSEDWAAAVVLRKLKLAGEVLAVHCLEPDCAGCVWHKPYPCPLAAIAQAALSLPVPG
jgi:hypothetical protein